MTAEIAFTASQLRAKTTVGQSLLVSAAAGSGKTAVLAERCAHLVCDSRTPCEIDELLVVTFTEAAAAEMRGRIQSAIRRRLETIAAPSPRLARQLALVEHAPIGTI
ncbi:MAG TPA: UvrD-helicase domain-containing protein, partial [Tepidisphaeraceae bacterium]|nr:UvrD-helicase domain-containing protein [Tepidisphaeraceae bacterium]